MNESVVTREPLNKSAAALSGSFAPTYWLENLEIHKGFLRFPNLNLEQNPSLAALAIESELPKKKILIPYICAAVFHALCIPLLVVCSWGLIHDALSTNIDQGYLFFKNLYIP